MKKLLNIFLVLVIVISVCACESKLMNQNQTNDSSKNTKESTGVYESFTDQTQSADSVLTSPTEEISNYDPYGDLAGAWSFIDREHLRVTTSMLIFNTNRTAHAIIYDWKDNKIYSFVSATYEIQDGMVHLTFDDEIESYYYSFMDEEKTMMEFGGEGYERWCQEPNAGGSIYGTWEPHNQGTFPLHIGNSIHTLRNMTFYRDGTFELSDDDYGTYRIIHDGGAIFMDDTHYESGESFEFYLLGCGFILFENSVDNHDGEFFLLEYVD